MSLVAVICRNQSPIEMAEWLRCIENNCDLRLDTSSRRGINPFTGQETTFHPEEGSALIIINGDTRGAIVPGSEFYLDGCLEVYSPTDDPGGEYRQSVAEIARMLDADVEWAI